MVGVKAKFSGHQTFSFRYGWLEKGFRFIKEEKKFTDPDAIVALGVGKNMVDSIKYWSEMTGIIADGENSQSRDFLVGDREQNNYESGRSWSQTEEEIQGRHWQ